jgi:putative type I site-specific restriction-modification system, S subunit
MKRYEAYKNCNIPWIKQIPSHWMTKRAKFLYKKEQRPVREEDSVVTCFRDGVVTLRKNRRTTGFTEAISEFGYQGIRKGDLVIHVMDAFAGAIGVSDSDGKGTPVYNVCTAYGDSNNYYYAYALREMARAGFIQSLYRGIRERSSDFRFDVFERQYLPVPPREEQEQIVCYLDWQVSKINRLIAAKRKEIDAIHDMEHLYIDHVFSEIANQKTILLKYLVEQFVDCPHETPEYCKDGDYCVIRTADQDYGCLRSETLMYRLTESEYTNRIRRAPLNAGDIVYGREGERWGLACVIPESEKFCLGQRIMQFVCNKQMVTPEYVMWALNSSYVRNQGILDTMGSTSPHVNISTIINFRIPYTSREHQDTLVSKIECTMQKYRQLCERIENEIQLLHDLRIRLISDVITGQVDVRGIQVPDDEYINNEITEEEFEEESENNEEE